MSKLGKIVILNGTPRSGKTSIAITIQNTFEGFWMNLGVDHFMKMTPEDYQPGIGLRPGGERPDLESIIIQIYKAMYESIAAHSRQGINVVVDVGHHDWYSVPRKILPNCARILKKYPVMFVGVHCSIEEIMKRRKDTLGVDYAKSRVIPDPVKRWQHYVHIPGIYDLEIDTSIMNSDKCAHLIHQKLKDLPSQTAFQLIGDMN